MNSKTAMRASLWILKRRRSSSSHSSVAKKLSHIALSKQPPTEPIEGRTPASRQRWPKASEVYWADSNGRRNIRFKLIERYWSKASAGVFHPRAFRGLELRVIATAAMSSALCALRSVPFGKYWRGRPLVFSLVPRCHELKPVVIDAHEVRRKAQRPEQKSDTRDALELCEGLRRGFYRSIVHVPSPAISDLRTTLSRRRHFIRIQTAEVNAVKRLLRGVGRNSGRRGSLRTDAHWQSLLASDLVPEQLQEHVRHHYAVWRHGAERVRALDLSLGESARERRDE